MATRNLRASTIALAALYGIAMHVSAAAAATAKTAAKPASEFFEAGGVRLRYLAMGQGETVLLLHGLHSTAYQGWQKTGLIGALAARHRVVALDFPGHGESDKPDVPEVYGANLIETARALLDHLGIAKAHVVGYSLGALVAMKLMARHPDRVLSGTVAAMGWMRDSAWLEGIWSHLPVMEAGNTSKMCIASIGQLEMTKEELTSIQAPVRVIIGDRDPLRRTLLAPLKHARPDWKVVEIEGGGHANAITKKQFRDELARWIDSQ